MKEERPIFQIDYPFIGCGSVLIALIFAPLMWLAAVRFVPARGRRVGLRGAYG